MRFVVLFAIAVIGSIIGWNVSGSVLLFTTGAVYIVAFLAAYAVNRQVSGGAYTAVICLGIATGLLVPAWIFWVIKAI